jgi:hypothetical protein
VESNLALQCPHCSLRKSDKMAGVDPRDGQVVPLFHPLQQQWLAHFVIDSTGVCHGLTHVGRATIEALQMNDPLPRIARIIQIGQGLIKPI